MSNVLAMFEEVEFDDCEVEVSDFYIHVRGQPVEPDRIRNAFNRGKRLVLVVDRLLANELRGLSHEVASQNEVLLPWPRL